MRLNALKNYFLNNISQVMYSKSGSFLFNTYFSWAISGLETIQQTFLLLKIKSKLQNPTLWASWYGGRHVKFQV